MATQSSTPMPFGVILFNVYYIPRPSLFALLGFFMLIQAPFLLNAGGITTLLRSRTGYLHRLCLGAFLAPSFFLAVLRLIFFLFFVFAFLLLFSLFVFILVLVVPLVTLGSLFLRPVVYHTLLQLAIPILRLYVYLISHSFNAFAVPNFSRTIFLLVVTVAFLPVRRYLFSFIILVLSVLFHFFFVLDFVRVGPFAVLF